MKDHFFGGRNERHIVRTLAHPVNASGKTVKQFCDDLYGRPVSKSQYRALLRSLRRLERKGLIEVAGSGRGRGNKLTVRIRRLR